MFVCTHEWSRITLIRSFTCKLPFLSRYISELLSRHGQGPVCRKSPKLLGPEKPFVKLRPTYSVTLGFLYVVKGMKIKITAKFRASRRLCFEDTKRIMSPTIHPKSFGTFEKRAPGNSDCTFVGSRSNLNVSGTSCHELYSARSPTVRN